MQARLFAEQPPNFNSNLLEDKKIGSQNPPPLLEPAFPHISFFEDTIVFFVFDGGKQKPLVVEKKTGKLFFCGEEIMPFRNYLSPFELDYNQRFKKTRLLELKSNGCVFVVNKGFDGRLFFLFWSNPESFRIFRGKPFWQASFWLHDRKAEWFVQDLHKPIAVW